MKSNDIISKSDLTTRMVQLQAEKQVLEQQMKGSLEDLVDSISPARAIRNIVGDVLSDKEIHHNLTSLGLHMGANLITYKVLGKNKSIKGYLSSALVQQITTTLINNNMPAILTGINLLIDTVLEDDEEEDLEVEPRVAGSS